jgi:signal transduction histidine kinase
MRSLAAKLTLAFLIVGLTGALLVALISARQTQRAFDTFVLQRYQLDLVERATEYYAQVGSWDEITAATAPPLLDRGGHRGPGGQEGADLFTLIDADGVVLTNGRQFRAGEQLSAAELRLAVPLEVDGRTAGYILFGQPPERLGNLPGSLEQDFLVRMRGALIWGALGATLVALLLGAFLARTIAQPVRELTAATQRVAAGEPAVQVPIRTADELGELAASFNLMSSDLNRATQARRQMTADIAHDLRTPLSIIMGYTEALSDGKLAATPEMYDVLHHEAQQLNHLIEDLRTLSLADTGELSIQPRPTAAADLLERAAAAQQGQAAAQGITLEVMAEDPLPPLLADPERMAQVLGNLLGNALRHTAEGGTVRLTAVVAGDEVQLAVSDSGSGIAAADLPHIFDRFYRGDAARQQTGESGLGLAIARSIVEAHGGTIAVESAPGVGSTFTISLPAANPSLSFRTK